MAKVFCYTYSWGAKRAPHAPPLWFNYTMFFGLPKVSFCRIANVPMKKSGSKGIYGGHLGLRHAPRAKFGNVITFSPVVTQTYVIPFFQLTWPLPIRLKCYFNSNTNIYGQHSDNCLRNFLKLACFSSHVVNTLCWPFIMYPETPQDTPKRTFNTYDVPHTH